MTLVIERLRPEDHQIIKICALIMLSSEPWRTLGRTQKESVDILTDSMNESYVFYLHDQIVGFAVLIMHGAFVGYIKSIAIAPKWRNRGLGRQAIGLLEKRIFQDHPNVFLCVSSYNKGAQRFYRKLGYDKVGEIPDYLINGHSEWIMRKTKGPKTEFYRKNG